MMVRFEVRMVIVMDVPSQVVERSREEHVAGQELTARIHAAGFGRVEKLSVFRRYRRVLRPWYNDDDIRG